MINGQLILKVVLVGCIGCYIQEIPLKCGTTHENSGIGRVVEGEIVSGSGWDDSDS